MYFISAIHALDKSRPLPAWLILAGLMVMVSFRVDAQAQDTIVADTMMKEHSPRKAIIYSAICPGLGQVYNKKYWKVPIIYGAGGAFAYFIGFNHLQYSKFRDGIETGVAGEKILIDGVYYEYEQLPLGRDYYRRYRDLSVLGLAAIYFLNVVDAMVDAYFFYYDVSDDLSMKVEPAIISSPGMTATVGLRINLGF